MSRTLSLAVATASGLLATTGCIPKKSESDISSNMTAPTLNTKADAELFAENRAIHATLQTEIKRQFLAAASSSGIIRQMAGSSGEILLSEIGISLNERSTLDVDATLSGDVSSRSKPTSNTGSAIPSMGANVQTNYHIVRGVYNVSFAFQERVTSAGEGEIIRYQLRRPLEVEENMKISSRVKLTVAAIQTLPKSVGTIVARFFDDISLSLDSGMAFERNSELSTRMYHRSKNGGYTELMRDFVNDILRPLCLNIVSKKGGSPDVCSVQLPSISDPMTDLESRMGSGVAAVKRCEKTSLSENFTPIYKLYFQVPDRLQVYTQESKAYLYEKVSGGWKRFGWSTVLGLEADAKCGSIPKTAKCVVARFGAQFFDAKCQEIRSGKLKLGVSNEDRQNIY